MDVVRAVFAAFAERDIEGVLRFAAPEIEFSSVTSDYAGNATPYRGHEGIREYFRDVAREWDELRITPTGRAVEALDLLADVHGLVGGHRSALTPPSLAA